MRLIDADELKEKLLKIQKDVVNKGVPRGNTRSDTWIIAYLLVFDVFFKMVDEMPRVTPDYDNHILYAYGKGYSKGREDTLSEVQQMKDYCKNDCDTLNEIWKEQKDGEQQNDKR